MTSFVDESASTLVIDAHTWIYDNVPPGAMPTESEPMMFVFDLADFSLIQPIVDQSALTSGSLEGYSISDFSGAGASFNPSADPGVGASFPNNPPAPTLPAVTPGENVGGSLYSYLEEFGFPIPMVDGSILEYDRAERITATWDADVTMGVRLYFATPAIPSALAEEFGMHPTLYLIESYVEQLISAGFVQMDYEEGSGLPSYWIPMLNVVNFFFEDVEGLGFTTIIEVLAT